MFFDYMGVGENDQTPTHFQAHFPYPKDPLEKNNIPYMWTQVQTIDNWKDDPDEIVALLFTYSFKKFYPTFLCTS